MKKSSKINKSLKITGCLATPLIIIPFIASCASNNDDLVTTIPSENDSNVTPPTDKPEISAPGDDSVSSEKPNTIPSQPSVTIPPQPTPVTNPLKSIKINLDKQSLDAGENLGLSSILTYDSKIIKNENMIHYDWEYKLNNQKEWNKYFDSGKDINIYQIPINFDKSNFRVKAKYENFEIISSEIQLHVNQINPVQAISLIPDQEKYEVGDELIVNSDVDLLGYAIDDNSNLHYQWEKQLPGKTEWIPLNRDSSVLDKIILTEQDHTAKFRLKTIFKNFEKVSTPIDLSVSLAKFTDTIKENNNFTQTDLANDSFSSIGTNDIKELGHSKRTVQKHYYDSEVWLKYHDDYKFVYPGQDRNYESNNNRYFTNANGDKIDAKILVYDERVTGENGNYVLDSQGHKIKYNNADWISEEIKNNTLKKHHAADNFYINNFDKAPTTTMEYNVSTGVLGPVTLGLYAPAGEIVTFTFDEPTWKIIEATNYKGLEVVINENYWDSRDANNSGGISNRYPFLETAFTIDPKSRTLKVGSPFGGGLSLRINCSLRQGDNFPVDNNALNIGFKVEGAVKCMFYQDGVTSPKNWAQQKELVKKGELAPILQALAPYHALTIPFSNLNQIGSRPVDSLIYPIESFRKWNDFLYLSNYYALNDVKRSVRRVNMEFCDDIWNGAGAWGGGMNFYCPTYWGIDTMFKEKPIDVFNAAYAWGMFHEINHSFQQNAAFFSRRTHPETNQVTGFNLSVISDAGRFRSELNYTGEQNVPNDTGDWPRLNNYFTVVKSINRLKSTDEYPIYSLLLFLLGSKNYVDYVRKDVIEDPCDSSGWTGMREIKRISDTYKLNLWPTFEDYGRVWRDTWPVSTATANDSEREMIESIKQYPAVDFVANHYATGTYLYNSKTQGYDYTGDVISPFEIPAGHEYTFDFDQFVVSTNQNFQWTKIKLDKDHSELGGTIKLDSTGRKVIYNPPKDRVNDVDEFDVTVLPSDTWANKPQKYVPGYKYKIKVRQVTNEPILEYFDNVPNLNNGNYQKALDALQSATSYKYRTPLISFKTRMVEGGKREGIRVKYQFVAPEEGDYIFYNIWDDWFRLYADNVKVKEANKWTNKWTQTHSKHMKKGEKINFEALVVNTGENGGFNARVEKDGQNISFFDNVLIPQEDSTITLDQTSILDTHKRDYQYKPRLIDKKIFNGDLSSSVNYTNYKTKIYDPSYEYMIASDKYSHISNPENMNDYSDSYFELWNQNHGKNMAESEFDVYLYGTTTVGSLYFGHRTDNHGNARPTHITITGSNHNGPIKEPLYDGVYGGQFDDRWKPYSVINFKQPVQLTGMHIKAYNEYNDGIIWKWFRMSPNIYAPMATSIAINNPLVIPSPSWAFKKNDDVNSSAFNNAYAISTKNGDTLEFTLDNAQGFAIIGQNNSKLAAFDVYVNDKKVNSQLKVSASNDILYNQVLFQYQVDKTETMKIRIVHNDNNPFYINYFMTFGIGTSIAKTIK